ncbi:MAG: hypothetical protein K8W52_16835 [Deltaproteobacteria bacterium]|nr:hypothetical protein [Deltaproteobacteria bacterium]
MASGDPDIGQATVRAALDLGRLDHDPVSCSDSTSLAFKTLRIVPNVDGRNMVLGGLLPEARADDCVKVMLETNTKSVTCDSLASYRLDSCLLEVEDQGLQSRAIVAAVVGKGWWAHRLSSSGSADLTKLCAEKPLDVLVPRDTDGATLVFLNSEGKPVDTELQKVATTAPELDAGSKPAVDVAARLGSDADVGIGCEKLRSDAKANNACPDVLTLRALDVCTASDAIALDWKAAQYLDYRRTISARDPREESANVFPVASAEFVATGAAPMAEMPAPAAVVNGLADYLISRAKQEVETFVSDQVVNKICAAKPLHGVMVRTYFPNTCQLLKGRFLDRETSIRSFGMTIQRSLEDDLLGLWPVVLNSGLGGKADMRIAPIVTAWTGSLTAGDPRQRVNALVDAFLNMKCSNSEDGSALTDESNVSCAMRIVGLAWSGIPPDQILRDLDKRLPLLLPTNTKASLAKLAEAISNFKRDSVSIDPYSFIAELPRLVNTLDNESLTRAMEQPLGRLAGMTSSLPDLASVLFRVGRAVVRGENPAQVFLSATARLECRGDDDDLACALGLSHAIVAAVLETRSEWSDPLNPLSAAHLDSYARDIERRVARLVATQPILKNWATKRFGELGKIALSSPSVTNADRSDLHTFVTSIITSVTSIDVLLVVPGAVSATDEQVANQARVQKLFAAGAGFFRVIVEQSLPSSKVKKAALETIDRSAALVSAGYHRDLPGFMTELYGLARAMGLPDPLPERIRDKVALVTALAGAHSAAEVKIALEKYAAPVGGYRVKHETGHHFTVAALVGLSGGYEVGVGAGSSNAGHLSLFAPVGVDLTGGHVGSTIRGLGLFASIVDVGAVASVRLKSDDPSKLPDPTWAQVLSPGLFLRMGFANIPFVVGGGVSYAPYAREDANGDRHGTWRVSLALSVDITLMPL